MRPTDFERARKWYDQHGIYVRELLDHAPTYGYPPGGSDVRHPISWTASHWKWFVEELAKEEDLIRRRNDGQP